MSLSNLAEDAAASKPRVAVATYALVGNPNCGKSTLFNALTGLKQKIGNYPGVTVEKKTGIALSQHGRPLQIVDLPGAYSLAPRSPDEAITRDVLFGRVADTPAPDRIVCVVDASNLERNLYLVHQILELGRPTILALNMMDIAEQHGVHVDADKLEAELGIPVVPCEAANGKGMVELRIAMSASHLAPPDFDWQPPSDLVAELAAREARLVASGLAPGTARAQARLDLAAENPDAGASIVQSRYAAIASLAARAIDHRPPGAPSPTERIDAVLIHPVYGWLAFGVLMALVFLGIFTLAETPMRWIGSGSDAAAAWVRHAMPPGDFRDLLTDGIIAGVGSVAAFLPQILVLFFFIGLLEGTGYMARAAFMMDRVMSRVGLNGKSFIPLLGSYACAIPGIMAARTIEEPKDRLTTILVAPLMSCSARLPVYLLLIAAMMPGSLVPLGAKVGLMLLMYALGTGGAFGFAWLFKRTFLRGQPPPLILELPPYRMPRFSDIVRQMADRSWMFVKQAGTVILAITIILWFISAYPKLPAGSSAAAQVEHSFAGRVGRTLEPAIRPLGFDWRIGIGLVSSFAAREVFVSSSAVVFRAEAPGEGSESDLGPLRRALRDARWPDGRPLFTPLTCLSLMLFYVFAMQCGSTLAVVRRETGSWKWPAFQVVYMTGTAWVVCFAVYQIGRLLGF